MFRILCRRPLKGDNRALLRVVLTLEPAARHKAKEAKEKDATVREASQKFDRSMRGDPDKIDDARNDPRWTSLDKRLDAMARNERRLLMREARRS